MDLISRRIAMFKCRVTDPTFRLFKMEVLTSDTILVEGSATTVFKSGKRKGQPKYIGPTTKAAITKREIQEEQDRYEKETGNCFKCLGKGVLQNGWSKAGGVAFISCPWCLMGAKGKAPQPAEASP